MDTEGFGEHSVAMARTNLWLITFKIKICSNANVDKVEDSRAMPQSH